jgi:hypothetical protein
MMKRLIPLILLFFPLLAKAQPSTQAGDTTVYLITCSPGTETYSLWGHSALRVVMPGIKYDKVYNWGVFDFETPNFAWKFAKGRLNYMLGVYGFEAFIHDYFTDQRSVISQKINLTPVEKLRLLILLQENMKPENRYYRYDFLYDNCSSRIRDIIEKLLGDKLIYPPDEQEFIPTYRDKISEYTKGTPWTKMGIDLLVGTPADKKASFRDRMFLPDDLQKGLTRTIINRDRKMLPLLYPAETLLDFAPVAGKVSFLATPLFALTLLFILIVILSALKRKSPLMNYIDIALFLIFSVFAVLMVFFNFFTDHIETRLNLNIIWFNPFLILCLWSLIRGRKETPWFKISFFTSALYVVIFLVMPSLVNISFLPVLLILMLRSSARAGFRWNPMSV